MRWQQGRRSSNVQNRSRMDGKGKTIAGGGGLFFVMAIVVALMGGNPAPLIGEGVKRTIQTKVQNNANMSEEELAEGADFVSVVLGTTEDVWGQIFAQNGQTYPQPNLVLFTGRVQSACGFATAASGPFYCPPDQKIYIDLSFFQDLKKNLNAPGDFAQAYVIAHEVGHHVQNVTGVIPQVEQMKRRVNKKQRNALQVRVELQADCYSGVWARSVQDRFNMIEAGDIDEALNAASQIGDDILQKQAQGYVVPDSFTHGSSVQRKTWFKRGFDMGSIVSCYTLKAKNI